MVPQDRWDEFDQLGAEQVRLKLAANAYGEVRSRSAREWLALQDSKRSDLATASNLAEAKSANDLAREANELALDANSSARDAALSAREANSLAREANAVALRSASAAQTSNRIAIAAMVVSMIALIASFFHR